MKITILKHPAVVLSSAAAGVAAGLLNTPLSAFFGVKNFAQFLSFPGELYLFFLQMAVIPIVITAISSGLGKIMRERKAPALIRKIIAVFLLCMVASAALGMAAGMFGKPGMELSGDAQTQLSKLLYSGSDGFLEVTLNSPYNTGANVSQLPAETRHAGFTPAALFHTLSLSGVIALLFLSVMFGVAIGFLPDTSASLLINLCTAIFEAFLKVINRALYLLPLALICLLAGHTAAVGVQIFGAMAKLVALYCAVAGAVFVVSAITIWRSSGIRNPFTVVSTLFEPTVLALATRSPLTVLPSAVDCLENKMGFNPVSVNLTLPLGTILGRFGCVAYFALATFFIAQIYNVPLEPIHYLIILAGAVFAGAVTAGAVGIASLPMLAIILEPLNLPIEAALVMLIAIDSVIDPLRASVNVHVNMAAAALVARNEAGREIIKLESGISKAEAKIEHIFSAKLAGTASEEDENTLRKLNEEINRLRREKKALSEK
ncbi:MAG: dicarboxylate/amino acid:cation symporter [Chitinispirillales bacterium]|jgi:proton glutamate symport protein|nr:dicarboxylate/amino acid:cation symporter [Chitinispirillales bacterium]